MISESAVFRSAHAVEDAPEHIGRHGEFKSSSQETDGALLDVQTDRTLKQLHEGVSAFNFQNLAVADLAVGQLDFAQLVDT
jgi:hypothetical protein